MMNLQYKINKIFYKIFNPKVIGITLAIFALLLFLLFFIRVIIHLTPHGGNANCDTPQSSNENKAAGLIEKVNEYNKYPDTEKLSTEIRAIGEKAYKPLCDLLKSKNPIIRMRVLEILGYLKDKSYIGLISEQLNSKDPIFRGLAVWALGKIKDEDAVEILLTAINDNDSKVKYGAIWALGQIGGDKACAAIIDQTKYSENQIRIESARALGNFNGRNAIKALIELLKDSNSYVIDAAADSLKKISSKDYGTDYNLWHEWFINLE
jgi:HEAT repeat protein